jgi:hypothetical protein
MKKLILILLSVFTLQGCIEEYRYLKGKYEQHTVWTDSSNDFDTSFDNAIDFLTDIGYMAEEVNKPSGYVRLKRVVTFLDIAIEEKKGLSKKDAIAVVPVGVPVGALESDLIILVRPQGSGTRIGVKLNLNKYDETLKTSINGDIASTGVYERFILEKIK